MSAAAPTKRVSRHFGHWSERVAETYSPERRAPRTHKSVVTKHNGKDAAMQWGFWHLGQFATDYQQLFAEKPSLTLHQRMREWG